MPLLSRLGIAWIIGIAVARWLGLPWQVAAIAGLPAFAALFLYRRSPGQQPWSLLGLALCTGAFRLAFFEPVLDERHIAFYNDGPTPVAITGLVVDEPDIRDAYINLQVQVETIEQAGLSQPVHGLVLVRAPRYPERAYGDRLAITGPLETPPIFEDFSYKEYLERSGIYSLIRRPRIELIASNQGSLFWTSLFAFKTRASQTINRILSEPYASLLNGILLGIETGIPKGLYEEFSLTGASHVIVISGLIATQTLFP